MEKINILNKQGMLTDEDRLEPFFQSCSYFTFETNLELSIPVKVTPHGNGGKYPLDWYSQDLASFICYWKHFVMKDLNGFSGFSHVKFELVNCELVQTTKP